jgi:hypothetical protein
VQHLSSSLDLLAQSLPPPTKTRALVICARSLGAISLYQYWHDMVHTKGGHAHARLLDRARAVVLSAAAINTTSFQKLEAYLSQSGVPLWVTINRRDRTILNFDRWPGVGRALTTPISAGHAEFFDVTDVPGIDKAHNYITDAPSRIPQIDQLHQLLLNGTWDSSNPPAGFAQNQPRIWTLR